MAQYYDHRNQGLNGCGISKEAGAGAAYRPAAIVGYSATSESYVSSTEQVVKLGGYPSDQVWPRSSTTTRAQPKIGDDYDYSYSPKLSHVNGSPHESPRKNFDGAKSPPHFHTNPHDSPRKNLVQGNRGDDDDDVEGRDGVLYLKSMEYNEEKIPTRKGISHHQKVAPPKYYYNTEKLPEANNIYGSNHTKPVTYNRFANKAPAPIKTRLDRHGDARDSPQWTPFGKEHQDSTEVHRRPQPQHKYKEGIIDSETLARKYGGVFVNDYK